MPSYWTYFDFRLGKLLGLGDDGHKGTKDLGVGKLIFEAGKVFLQFTDTAFTEVELHQTVSEVPPLSLCPASGVGKIDIRSHLPCQLEGHELFNYCIATRSPCLPSSVIILIYGHSP